VNISTYLSNALLNHSLGVAVYTPPSTIWGALYTSAPNVSGGGVEVNASDYARVATTWVPASNEQIQNAGNIRFPASGNTLANWGTVIFLGLFDTLVGGNLLWFGALSAPIALGLGTNFQLAPNTLTISLS
jgi:hypothetical protein